MIPKWAIFLSGRGSTAQAAMDMMPELDVRLVVSNKSNAKGVARAKRMGVPVLVLEKNFSWLELDKKLKSMKIDNIFLLGFMKLLPPEFVNEWTNKILNIHPSLLPLFPGLNALEASFESDKPMGVSIHQVIDKMDAGPLILQKKIERKNFLSLEKASFEMARLEQLMIRKVLQKLNHRSCYE